jgi:hypothetical protein
MKKSTHIHLVLITAALASCHRPNKEWSSSTRYYMRSDTTAPYTRVYHPGAPGIWYYAFRPYGMITLGRYRRLGYYSDAISEHSNVGTDGFKAGIVRGGFGGGESASS